MKILKLMGVLLFGLVSTLNIGQIQAQETVFIASEEAKTYQIDTENSYIHIYTGTSGFLKSLSHKHLIAIRDIEGSLVLNGEDSVASFSVRPNNFLVDADEERARAVDEEYQEEVASWIKTGTKGNMNGSRLLEADIHPVISIEVSPLDFNPEAVDQTQRTTFSVSIRLKAEEYQINVPGNLIISEQSILANGDFELDHKDLGLKQFSVPGGVSKVANKLRFVFEIQSKLN